MIRHPPRPPLLPYPPLFRSRPRARGGLPVALGPAERGLGCCEPCNGDAERGTGHIIEADRVAERDRGRITAMLAADADLDPRDRKSTRLNSSHSQISYAVFC